MRTVNGFPGFKYEFNLFVCNSLCNYGNYTIWMLYNLFFMKRNLPFLLLWYFTALNKSMKNLKINLPPKLWDLISSSSEQPYLCSCAASPQNQAIQSNLCRSQYTLLLIPVNRGLNNHPSLKNICWFLCMSKTLACCLCATVSSRIDQSMTFWCLLTNMHLRGYVSMFQTQQFWLTGLFHTGVV